MNNLDISEKQTLLQKQSTKQIDYPCLKCGGPTVWCGPLKCYRDCGKCKVSFHIDKYSPDYKEPEVINHNQYIREPITFEVFVTDREPFHELLVGISRNILLNRLHTGEYYVEIKPIIKISIEIKKEEKNKRFKFIEEISSFIIDREIQIPPNLYTVEIYKLFFPF